MWDLGNKSNWDLALRNTYYASVSSSDPKVFVPIPPVTTSVNSYTLLIGVENSSAPSHWYLAGYACPRLLFTPSFDSDFLSLVQSNTGVRLGLNRLNLVSFSNYNILPYILEINVARWHKEMSIEVWQYIGSELDIRDDLVEIKSDLDRIETKIDSSSF